MGKLEDVGCELRLAAELARQWPFGTGPVAMDATHHPRAGRRARHLLDLGLAIDGKHRDTTPKGGRNLALFLNRVAIRDALGRRARRQHRLGFAQRSDVERRAELDQQAEDLRRRVRFDRVEHAGVGQCLGERQIVLAHDIEVDHEAGPFIGAVFEEFADACGHLDLAPLDPVAA